MVLGKVVGTLWGAKQSPTLEGRRIVEVRPVMLRNLTLGSVIGNDVEPIHLANASLLAVDPLGADIGQLVLVAIGSRVRDICLSQHVPTKHCVVAIVDKAQMEAP